MDQEAPVFDQVIENGRKLLDTIESPEEKEALKSKLDDTEKKFNTLQDKINEDLAKTKDVADKTKALDDKMADLERNWMIKRRNFVRLNPSNVILNNLNNNKRKLM